MISILQTHPPKKQKSMESCGTIYYKHYYGNKLFEQSLLQKFTKRVAPKTETITHNISAVICNWKRN